MQQCCEAQKARINSIAKLLLGDDVQVHFVTSGSWLSFEIASPRGERWALGMTKPDAAEKKSDSELASWLATLLAGYYKMQPLEAA
jgi:hypothetical protein